MDFCQKPLSQNGWIHFPGHQLSIVGQHTRPTKNRNPWKIERKTNKKKKSILPLPKTEILGKQKEDSLPKTEIFGFLYCRGKIILYLKNKEIVENKKKTRSPKTEIRGK